jgi:peptide/nickel transport system substrate-binding protein
MSKGSRLGSSQGVTRRGFTAGAVGAGLILGSGRAPAIAQGKRDLRVGVWGGEFGNLSPVIRYDIQGGLVLYNIFDSLVEINFAKRSIEPMLAIEWSNPDPLTWRMKLREGVKWQKGFGGSPPRTWLLLELPHRIRASGGTALFPVDSVKADGKYVVEVKTKRLGAFPASVGYGGTIISAKAHRRWATGLFRDAGRQQPVQIESSAAPRSAGEESRLLAAGFPKLDKIVIAPFPIQRPAQALLRTSSTS